MKYFIQDFSTYDFWTVKSHTPNISNVVDKLLRLTTKLTESYAGDIVYLIDALNECIEGEIPFERLITFREGGVNWFPVENSDEAVFVEKDGEMPGLQYWHLKYEPINYNTCCTVLRRVCLKTDQSFPEYLGGST